MTNVESRLWYPALALIAVAAANGLIVAVWIFSLAIDLLGGGPEVVFLNEAERLGYYTGRTISILLMIAGAVATPLIINGALEMMNGTGYTKARLAATLALIPGTSLCCIFGIPVGLWALAVLASPDVKAHFGVMHGPAAAGGERW